MIWIILSIVIVMVIIFLAGRMGQEDTSPSKNITEYSKAVKSPKEIVSDIVTIAQFRSLERKLEKADEKRQESQAYDSRSLKSEQKAEDKYQTLQEAFDLASNKILRWQFIPNLDLNTTLIAAQSSHKTFSLLDYKEKLDVLSGNPEEWLPLRGDEEPDEKVDDVKFIIKFRKIIENLESSNEEKDKKVNSLVSRNHDKASNYFDIDGGKTPAEQWREECA